MSPPSDRAVRITFGVAWLVTAALLLAGIFMGLPTRYAPVDVTGGVLGGLLTATAALLLLNHARGKLLARVASWVTLGLGILVIALLSSSAGYLRGAYGPVGQGGALIFVFVIALVFPYTVALPCACLVWVGPRSRS
jgi:hypothetical protein